MARRIPPTQPDPKRTLRALRTGTKTVWLFAAAAFLLIALGIWWGFFISQSINAQRTMMGEILGEQAETHALRLKQATVRPGPLTDDPHLEVVDMTARLSPLARRVGDGFEVEGLAKLPGVYVVQPTAEAEHAMDERYNRQRKMLLGEGTLLTSLLLSVVAMLWRLVRTESRFRREMQDFLGRVTHEMKTPLAGIKAVLQTIHTGRMPQEQLVELTAMALREVEREEHLIQNLLLAQRMRLPNQHLSHDPVDITALLRRFHDHRKSTAPPGGLHLDAPDDLHALGDSTALWTILENLGDNAQKYGAKRIQIVGKREGAAIVVHVVDDGAGFAPELAEKLFQPFVRAEGTAGKAHGTGLGLSLSRALAERMGGHLVAQSPGEGQGATFTLSLPVEGRAPTR